MTIHNLLEKCDEAYYFDDYEKLVSLCDEVLEIDSSNPTAMGYKSVTHVFFISDDEENISGRVLMKIYDEIRRVCRNEDNIDWEYTEYLKHKPWR